MKLAVCVHFHGDGVVAAGVAFDEWDAPEASRTFTSRVAHIDKPLRAELDLRALPCLMLLLQEHALRPDVILMDAPVHLDASETPGLGLKLYEALGGRLAIIGVSTRSMPGMPAQFEVFREEEARPVIVTSVGVDIGAAKTRVRAMHGKRRIPTLLKLAARIARESSP
ncbi:endonuclease V [Azohydromonas lata]|uniref:Endonuclease V n=1 Tax=Azohydromonas lata TaxID=45677 RepID=A0ABU5IPU6_9BURK|nr:endonuclease V [Azohydromonas lata]MDZ5460919.1 endonuclease V [Azohydromonas lata]